VAVQLWDTFDSDPVYANPAGGVQQFDPGRLSLTTFTAYDIDLTFWRRFRSPASRTTALPSIAKATLAEASSTPTTSTVVGEGIPPTVGSNPSLDGGNSALAMQLYAVSVPEPSTFTRAAGCLALLVGKLRRS
jgi:hypothetical protein